jgi:hypothetical protein
MAIKNVPKRRLLYLNYSTSRVRVCKLEYKRNVRVLKEQYLELLQRFVYYIITVQIKCMCESSVQMTTKMFPERRYLYPNYSTSRVRVCKLEYKCNVRVSKQQY